MKSKTLLLCLIALASIEGQMKADLITTNVARFGVIVDSSLSYFPAVFQ